ncbi:unnamed protein product [Zymoseptoria tritici ST99CH_3D1]|nr:unnamed protein product [Zymoseptoria tritici ST99CH_3D1]
MLPTSILSASLSVPSRRHSLSSQTPQQSRTTPPPTRRRASSATCRTRPPRMCPQATCNRQKSSLNQPRQQPARS